MGVLSNLPEFLKVLAPDARENYAQKLADVFNVDPLDHDWRQRELVAKQLKNYAALFAFETVYARHVPLLLALCADNIAAVRDTAARSVFQVYKKLEENEERAAQLVESVRGLKRANKFLLRQWYAAAATL